MCGGTISIRQECQTPPGLSPRVRGNLPCATPARVGDRSIPACAGEPRPDRRLLYHAMVYPRVCGGTLAITRGRRTGCGLSPRVRGNPFPFRGAPIHERSIPACAGEPSIRRPLAYSYGVYPRVCGGTKSEVDVVCVVCGLSPRVRGNRSGGPGTPTALRSIPACAGEPGGGRRRNGDRRVYPRVCGGTFLIVIIAAFLLGLSPRVRGNQR